MTTNARNLHATAIVIGTKGFLFIGPSGSGKTESALACAAQAQSRAIFAAFVGDDQVMISVRSGRVVAEAIDTIAGRAEVRGAEIVDVPAISAAVMDYAVQPVDARNSDRLPPENEQFHMEGIGSLPLLRLPQPSAETLDILLRIAAARA
ncbi:HPr kinase/phosphorylase [Rhizobium sp. C4]|uniref:HPr kinase/phosphorylase n=1 Tax=Rhizobium sp. C4 TaxID=1349800 RepID=UPI001E5A1EF8|nr:HPr kinase/phosphatase C-terminal domain-containing protein [Rhizobium sp. C4]MCD2174665.1 HPr kinase/phosphatase C-terminal domain-containing protein [Rhizobium sp. C4]